MITEKHIDSVGTFVLKHPKTYVLVSVFSIATAVFIGLSNRGLLG